MRLKHLQRVLNIRNAFETLATCFEYSQRVFNTTNAFETLVTCFEYQQRKLFQTRFSYSKQVANILNELQIFKMRCKKTLLLFKTHANIQNALEIFQTRWEYSNTFLMF